MNRLEKKTVHTSPYDSTTFGLAREMGTVRPQLVTFLRHVLCFVFNYVNLYYY
jgi:hypothetical protein